MNLSIKDKVETMLTDRHGGEVEITNISIDYKTKEVYFSFWLNEDGDVYGESDSMELENFLRMIGDEE